MFADALAIIRNGRGIFSKKFSKLHSELLAKLAAIAAFPRPHSSERFVIG